MSLGEVARHLAQEHRHAMPSLLLSLVIGVLQFARLEVHVLDCCWGASPPHHLSQRVFLPVAFDFGAVGCLVSGL